MGSCLPSASLTHARSPRYIPVLPGEANYFSVHTLHVKADNQVQSFKSILFVAAGGEGDKSVFPRAVRLASANSAKLTLFAALDAEGYQFDDQETGSAVEAINKAHLEERREELESLREEALSEHPQLSIDVAVETGTMALSVILAVLVNHHDLVMKAADGNTGRWQRLFGTGDQKLMRKCPCPVWIVKPSTETHFRRIFAAVDLDPTEPDTESLAKRIMELATTVHLVKGRAGDVIPDLAESLEADLVVIGTVGRTGVPGLLIGNTAEEILNSVDCSVLTLKPEGFQTPIQV